MGCGKRDLISGEIALRSASFAAGGSIPKRHANAPEGANLSPPLAWSGGPEATVEWVVIVEDPVPNKLPFVHWVLYGIPGSKTSLPEGLPGEQPRAGGAVQGTNDFGYLGWGGPLPHPGEPPHRYWFWVYALDTHLTLPPGATKTEVVAAMKQHILSNGKMFGHYEPK